MKRFMMVSATVACLGVMSMSLCAEEEAAPKVKKQRRAKRAKPALEELQLSGVISKQEKQKGEGEKVAVRYILTDTEGNIVPLPRRKIPRKKKGEDAPVAINLDDYLDVGVNVVGLGHMMDRKGKKVIVLKSITAIEKPDDITAIDIFADPAAE